MKNLTLAAVLFFVTFGLRAQNICKRNVTNFSPSSTSYTITGTAELKDSLGVLRLSFSNDFSTDRGPDLFVYLSVRNEAPTVMGNTHVQVAKLQSNSGAQSYIVPSGTAIDDFHYVSIHCNKYNSFWDGGPLDAKTCGDTASYDTTTTGIESLPVQKRVKVFPNPTSGELQIESKDNFGPLSIVIYNAVGQTVTTSMVDVLEKQTIDLGEKSGIYTVEVRDDNGVAYFKILNL